MRARWWIGLALAAIVGAIVFTPRRNVEAGNSVFNTSTPVAQPLFSDDSGTVIHAMFRYGSIYDSTGTRWTRVGAPTYVAASPASGLPAGASAFSGSNYYRTAATSDPADIASFAACAVVAPTTADLATTSMVLSNGYSAPTSGYEVVANETGAVKWISANECSDSPLVAAQPNVICFGQDSSIGKMYMKVNMRPLVVNTGVLVPLDTYPLKLGTHFDDLLGFAGTIYEVWFSSSLPGGASAASYGPELWDEYFAELIRKAYLRMGIVVTSATSIVYQSTCNVHVASTNQLLEISASNGTAFTVAAPTAQSGTTIRNGQRFTLRIKNASGGALGAITWNAIYKMSTWTNPANATSRSVTFEYNGTNWIEINKTAADVAN